MIGLLCSEPLGQIVGSNIVDARANNLVDDGMLKAFLENCVLSYTEDRVKTTEELVAQFIKTARGLLPQDPKTRRCFSFMCTKRTRAMATWREFSTVTELGTFKKHLVSDSAVKGHASFLTNPDPADPMLAVAIATLNGRPGIYQRGARLGGGKNAMFWIAPARKLEELRARLTPQDLGDAVRDLLGLVHYEADRVLVEIRFPNEKVTSRRHARPTFADAGEHRRFRTLPDGAEARRRPGWGHTVDLKRLFRGDAVIDGIPERVVAPLEFDDSLNPRFEFAGASRTTRGSTSDDNDAAFASRILGSRTVANLEAELLAVFV